MPSGSVWAATNRRRPGLRIALLCATRRGSRFLRRLHELVPQAELAVFSFPEEPWEPPFLDEIRALTIDAGGTFLEARQVGAERLRSFWEDTPIDLMFAVSWRYMVSPQIYRLPRHGTFVFHDSLLPAYRGFAPTVWAMVNGEDHTGVTLFEIAEDVDSGAMVDQERIPIGPDETIADVMDAVTEGYLRLLERNVGALLRGEAVLRQQDESRATYTCKRIPEDARLVWSAPTAETYNLIRASTRPYSGAFTSLSGQHLRVWGARRLPDFPVYAGRIPGRIIRVVPGEGSIVLTGDGALLLTEVQLEGKEPACAADVLNSIAMTLGS